MEAFVFNKQLSPKNKLIHIRTLPKETYLEKLLEYRVEELLEFQDDVIKRINEVLNMLNLGKLSI